MSVNNSVQNKTYVVTIDVPETLIEALFSQKKKPSLILSKIIERMALEMDVAEIIDYAEKNMSLQYTKESSLREKTKQKYQFAMQKWTYPLFEQYVKNLVSEAERRSSVADLISMLIAYLETSSRPTSEELREAKGFGPGEMWYEELRTTKARLTIAAKHLDLPSFFLRAYGSGLNRRHPMDEEVYNFLRQWVSRNKSIVERYKKMATPRSAG